MATTLTVRPPRAVGEFTIRQVDPRAEPRWLEFVGGRDDALVYHHPAWLAVIEQAYGHRVTGLLCEDDTGQVQGVLPLGHTHGLVSGRRLASLPHTPVAGPLATDAGAAAALVAAAVDLARRRPGTQLQLKARSNHLDGLVVGVVGVPWEATYVLELPAEPATLRFGSSRNQARLRWAANKAARLGVRVREAEAEAELRAWYRLYLDTMRWHAVPPRPYRFFAIAWRELRPLGLLRLLLAEQRVGGQTHLLAGSIFFLGGQTVHYAFNGRDRAALALRPNDVIQWQAIQDACQAGYRWYDFGEVDAQNQGLADFKAKWGAEPRRLYRYYWPAPRELETGFLAETSMARRLATATWRRLPLAATARLGGLIYRYV